MNKIRRMVYIALFSALIAVCSLIQIPSTIPFTLQIFAIAFTLLFLGGKDGFLAILIYIILGIIGAPIFSGLRGGIGVIMSNTGGFILGFLFIGLSYWFFESLKIKGYRVWGLALGEILMYVIGSVWFVFIADNNSDILFVISACVLPFIIPDILKISLAFYINSRVSYFKKN